MGVNRKNRFCSSDLQKFRIGDIVRIKENALEAVILGSYRDLYGGVNIRNYSLRLENGGESAWHHENEIELIEMLEQRDFVNLCRTK